MDVQLVQSRTKNWSKVKRYGYQKSERAGLQMASGRFGGKNLIKSIGLTIGIKKKIRICVMKRREPIQCNVSDKNFLRSIMDTR